MVDPKVIEAVNFFKENILEKESAFMTWFYSDHQAKTPHLREAILTLR